MQLLEEHHLQEVFFANPLECWLITHQHSQSTPGEQLQLS
jgi:hypothetical protein